MKYFFALSLLFSNLLFSQETKFKIIAEVKINDSLVLQTCDLRIFNNTAHPICIKVSTTFREKILSKDTIRLASLGTVNECPMYDLWISQENLKLNVYNYPSYPLILNTRTTFVATISLLRNLKCKDLWIGFSYLGQSDIDYNRLMNKYNEHLQWDSDPKLKFRNNKIYLK